MRMHCTICVFIVMLAVAIFSGCGKRQGDYGNFAGADSVELVQDAMKVLAINYPPAKTRLALLQEVEDRFGSALLESLRDNGYAVVEYSGPARGDKYLPIVEKPDGLPFGYVLDNLDKTDELRVTLHVGAESLSRLYFVQRSGKEFRYVPQGFWTRKQ